MKVDDSAAHISTGFICVASEITEIASVVRLASLDVSNLNADSSSKSQRAILLALEKKMSN